MPWNDNSNNGGSGGPWGPGGGGNKNNNNPWGNGPRKPGGGGGGGGEPDLEDLLRGLNNFLGGLFGGGKGTGQGSGKGGKGGGAILGLIIGVGLLVLVAFTSLFQVGPGEAGVVLRFGEYTRTSGPGLQLKMPYPVEQATVVDVSEIRTLTIGENEREALMVTRDENIVDISFTVQWQIDPQRVQDYLFKVRDPEEMVRRVSESAMREVVGTSDLEPIIGLGRDEVVERAEEILQITLDLYESGVLIVGLQLREAAPPTDVIAAYQDVIQAEQDAERNALDATGYANRIVPEARGDAVRLLEEARAYRDQVIVEAQGEADRFVSIYDEYAQAEEVTRRRMFLETMEQVLRNSELIILDGQGGAVPYLPLDRLGQSRTTEQGG